MDEDLLYWGFVLVAIAGFYGLRWYYRHRVLEVEHVHSAGEFGGISAYVVSSSRGRRYVALEYVVENQDGDEFEKQVLLSMKQAAALANHLRVAASPHASLVLARAAVRREAAAAKARA